MLPVSRKDIVTAKVYAFTIVELLHIVSAVMLGIAHNLIYGTYNFGMDINPAFFGIIFMTFGLFNIIFLPQYFKTAYKFGAPVIVGNIAILLFVGFFEFSAQKNLFLLKYKLCSSKVLMRFIKQLIE
ncbi:MAG: ABC-2 transporter permease [Tenericutes bacterium]|nr:ABC-2 transporter permease [Mycoplasmatota bacterium]